MVIEIIAGVACVWAGVEGMKARKARERMERSEAFYRDMLAAQDRALMPVDDIRPAFKLGATELCGGCGHMLSKEYIDQCKGEHCPHFLEVGAQKKIPIGYSGHLHKPHRSYMK